MTQDHGIYLTWNKNNALYSIKSAIGETLISTIASCSFARFRFKGIAFLKSAILAMVMGLGTVLVIPLYLMFSKINLVNSIWTVMWPFFFIAFGVFFIKVYVQESVPKKILQSVRIDLDGKLSDDKYYPRTVGLQSWFAQATLLARWFKRWFNKVNPKAQLRKKDHGQSKNCCGSSL